MRTKNFCAVVIALVFSTAAGRAWSMPPSDELLPSATLAYVATQDVQALSDRFSQTQLGKLIDDPIMQPFIEDLRRQLHDQLGVTGTLGLTWDDVQGIATGEAALAHVWLRDDHPARVVIVDVAKNQDRARQTLNKALEHLRGEGARQDEVAVGDVTLYVLRMPDPQQRQPSDRERAFFLADGVLCGAQSEAVARLILTRLQTPSKDTLQKHVPYQTAIGRCRKDAGEAPTDVTFFLDPFGYWEAKRADNPQLVPSSGVDLFKVLMQAGFGGIRGVGGLVHFPGTERDAVFWAKFYAPPPLEKSLKILDLPNDGPLTPPEWVFSEIANYRAFNVPMLAALDHFGPLFDALFGEGEEGVWEDVLESLEFDKNGPQVSLRKEIFAHLKNRAVIMTDYIVPITPQSERRVSAVEVTDEPRVAKGIEKLMRDDPTVRRREVGEFVIWEMLGDGKDMEIPELDVDNGGDRSRVAPGSRPRRRPQRGTRTAEKQPMPRSAVCVANGRLYIATHIDFLIKVLTQEEPDPLHRSVDYRLIDNALTPMMQRAGVSSLAGRLFSHLGEVVRPTYELVRQNRMGEAETTLGKIVNHILEDEQQKGPRQQEIDGSKLPEFEAVRRYFGPAGSVLVNEEDGIYLFGLIYNKEARVATAEADGGRQPK